MIIRLVLLEPNNVCVILEKTIEWRLNGFAIKDAMIDSESDDPCLRRRTQQKCNLRKVLAQRIEQCAELVRLRGHVGQTDRTRVSAKTRECPGPVSGSLWKKCK